MSDFNEIIDYFRLSRRSEEAKAQNKSRMAVEVNGDFQYGVLHEDDILIIEKSALDSGIDIRPLNDVANTFVTTLYIVDQPNNETEYYIQKEFSEAGGVVAKYQRVPFSASESAEPWEVKNDTVFKAVNDTADFYYSFTIEKVLKLFLDEVPLFPDTLAYLPKDLPDEAPYEFDYIDEEGYDNSLKDTFFRVLLSTILNLIKAKRNRIVQLEKNKDAAVVHLFPSINYKDREQELHYNRYEKGISFHSAMGVPIIILKFRYVGAMLEYLNKTIFYRLTEPDDFSSELRKDFIDHYNWIISDLVRSKKGNALLEVLYFLPDLAFQHLDDTNLWDIVDNMLENPVTNAGLNKEDILVKLITAIHQNSRTDQIFLLELLKQNRKKETRLQLLIYRLDGKSNTKVIKFLYGVWKNSTFTLPDEKQNPMFKDTNGLLFLPYESEKWAGFYFSNTKVHFKKLEILIAYETGKEEDVELSNPKFASGKGTIKREIIENYKYHPFYPIYIKNVDKQDTLLDFETIVPAFVLFANDDKAFWHNFIKTGEYTLDFVTTLSGLGNLAKFRYLTRLARLAEAAEGVSGAAKVVEAANILRYVKGAAGVVEITSGSVNVMLKFFELDETEFGQSLSRVLFYLELITLTGELTVPLKTGLKKSAKEVIEKSNPTIRKAHRELFDELYRITGLDELGRKILKVANIEDLGKQGNKIVFKILDDFGNEIGTLIRTTGNKGRKLLCELKISGKTYPISSSTELLNPQLAKSYDLPINHGENILYADFNIPTNITENYSGLGKIMLDDTLAFYLKNPKFGKVDGIFGVWVKNSSYYDDYGGLSLNLRKFWKAMQDNNNNIEESAFETFTGDWAKNNEFIKIEFLQKNISAEKVKIKFLNNTR